MMLGRSTHILYISGVVALMAALLLRPASPPQAQAPLASPAPQTEQAPSERLKPSPQRMTGEVVDRCLHVAHEIDPAMGERLEKMRRNDPAKLTRLLNQEGGRPLRAMAQLKERDPDLYRLKLSEFAQNVQVHRLAAQLRKAKASGSKGEIESIQKQLQTVLELQLAMSLKTRGDYVCKLEEQIERVREEMSHDAKNFKLIIEARMEHLLKHHPAHEQETELDETLPVAAEGFSVDDDR